MSRGQLSRRNSKRRFLNVARQLGYRPTERQNSGGGFPGSKVSRLCLSTNKKAVTKGLATALFSIRWASESTQHNKQGTIIMTKPRVRSNGKNSRDGEKSESQASTLVALASDAVLFHDGDEAYARIPVSGHFETWRIGSKSFKFWLLSKFWTVTRSAANSQAVQDAIGVLRGQALFEGKQHTTAVRVSGNDDCIWLDLANDKWQAVRIDAKGWRVVDKPNVAFIRPRGVLPLPIPETGGSLDELRDLVNVPDDNDWILIMAWLVASLRPSGPYPVLSINGEQGSAKSTLCRMLRARVDPNVAALRSGPRDERDLVIAGSNGHIVALENLSKVPDWLSDALCRLSTGGGFGTRELFSDNEEKLFNGQRPVMLNGITELCTRSDLLDRSIVISLPAIGEQKRTAESDLWTEFESIRARTLGALLDAVSQACSARAHICLDALPRMADFATWSVAAEPALPCDAGDFLRAYSSNRSSANETAIEGSVLSGPVFVFMESRDEWQGTASALRDELESISDERIVKGKDWPKKPHLLSGELKRIAPNLRRTGIDVQFGKSCGKRFVRLMRTGTQNSVHSVQSVQTQENAGDSSADMDAAGRSQHAQNGDSAHDSSSVLRDQDAVDAQDAVSQHCSDIDIDWLEESHL